jgi:hypothetical protein
MASILMPKIVSNPLTHRRFLLVRRAVAGCESQEKVRFLIGLEAKF